MFKPYRIQMVQQLSDKDDRRRLDFCLQLQDLMSSDDHFLGKVQFSDEATIHISCEVRQYLNTVLPERWIGRASGNDQPLMLWPQRSPDINPVIFSLGICQRPGIRPTNAT